jgi:adenylate cyclase
MSYTTFSAEQPTFADRLRNAGVQPGDSEQEKINKSLLVFATGLFCSGSMVWLMLYWLMGPKMPIDWPFYFELVLVANLLFYIRTGNFKFFRVTQLGLFLLAPFAMQWAIGSFITASGVILWGLLGPIGAILCFGVRESVVWFVAWVVLTAVSGYYDFYPDLVYSSAQPLVPIRTSVYFFALNFIAVATLIYTLLRYSIMEQQKAKAALEQAHLMLQAEQERSEKLLLNTLPGPIARRLKNSNETIADGYANASVMFADIVNFTTIAAGMTPLQVFSMLNSIFSAFDELTEKHKLEKIKTIGDAYMVASGINQGASNSANDHTAAMADLAVAMRDLLHRDFAVNSLRLEMRIGISTGPVIAGVVGKNKFIYDLWGDTVNLAARITSEGTPGMVHCDTKTQKLLRDRFEFDTPQLLHLKGKGEMQVYRLVGRNNQP